MKNFAVAFLILATTSIKAQEAPKKKNEFKVISITYSSYAKPKTSELYNSDFMINDQTYEDLRRNNGISIRYSQMNFIKNCGIEYGIGAELTSMSNAFNFTLPTLNADQEIVALSTTRSNVGAVIIPLYYVHRIELGKGLTLFPKIGVDAKVLITNPQVGRGVYTDSLNNLNYQVDYETSQHYANGPFQNVFLNGTIGASLTWSMKKGGALGLQLAFSMQLLRNTLLTRIKDIQYKKDGEVVFDSNQFHGDYYYTDENGNMLYQPKTKTADFLAENKMTNFSIGVSYVFGKK